MMRLTPTVKHLLILNVLDFIGNAESITEIIDCLSKKGDSTTNFIDVLENAERTTKNYRFPKKTHTHTHAHKQQ